MLRLLTSIFTVLLCSTAMAQALLPDNPAEAVRAAYRYPKQLSGFTLSGESTDPDPLYGVSLRWSIDGEPEPVIDVFLFQARHPRSAKLGVSEGMERYFDEIEQARAQNRYRVRKLDRRTDPLNWKLRELEWQGVEHQFRFSMPELAEFRSYTMMFYEKGHLIELRASSNGKISAGKLRSTAQALMKEFLAEFRVLRPAGYRCERPDFIAVSADDPRAGKVSDDGAQLYLPETSDDQARAAAIKSGVTAGIAAQFNAGCYGDGVRAELNKDEAPSAD